MLQVASSGRSLIYIKKNVGTRMEPGGTAVLTGYFSRTYYLEQLYY